MAAIVKSDEKFDMAVFSGNGLAEPVELLRCIGNEVLFDANTRPLDVKLTECTIKTLRIRSYELQNLVIRDCLIEILEIVNSQAPHTLHAVANLSIHGSTIGTFMATNAVLRESVIGLSIFEDIKFENGYIASLAFEKVEIKNQFRLLNPNVGEQLVFSSCAIGGLFFTEGHLQSLTCKQSTITDDAEFTMTRYDEVLFEESKIATLVLSGGICQSARIIAGDLGYLEISANQINDLFIGSHSKWDIHKMNVNKINLVNYIVDKDCQVRLYNLNVRELLLNSFENHGRFDVADVIVGYCNMGNARLNRSVLNNVQFEKLELFSAVLSDSIFSNIIWPADYQLEEFDQEIKTLLEDRAIENITTIRKITMYSKVADAYCQLKGVCLKQNNKFAALQFQMHEMRFQYRITILKTFKSGTRSFLRHFKDWLLLGTNRLFSDFGVSWWKPLRALFIFVALYLWWINAKYDLGLRFLNPSEWSMHSWSSFQHGLSLYVKLLSPVRDGKVGTLVISDFAGISIMDFFVRVITGYFIYNFVRGTRKFNFGI